MKTVRTLLACCSLIVVLSCQSRKELMVSRIPGRPVYMRPALPGARYEWAEGDWVVRKGQYRWKQGHWKRTRKTWIEGNWRWANGGWTWQKGYWKRRDLPGVSGETAFQ